MKRLIHTMLLILFVMGSCYAEKPKKYVPRSDRMKEKYATPEPGTYLKPVAYSLLVKMNKAMEDPDSFKEPSDWVKNMFTAPQKKLLDTLLQYNGTEVPVRIYYPTRQSLEGRHPVTLFFHGGGFIKGSVEQYHIMVSKLARVTGNIMVSVEYRLAPEHPFPTGLMDCYAVLQWFQKNGIQVGADTSRISVMGDSAGGNIATVLTLICRDRKKPQPESQILIYPGLSFADTSCASMGYFGKTADKNYVLSESFLRKVKAEYLGKETNLRHPYLSPLEASLTADLAPALIITAECDPLRDGGRSYASALELAGVKVEYLEYSGMIHAFMSFHMVLGDALNAMKQVRNYLERL
ncbi:MAG: alpha/beta hydrolase [Bacteroidota bacterium]